MVAKSLNPLNQAPFRRRCAPNRQAGRRRSKRGRAAAPAVDLELRGSQMSRAVSPASEPCRVRLREGSRFGDALLVLPHEGKGWLRADLALSPNGLDQRRLGMRKSS